MPEKTGTPDFDELLYGGFPQGASILFQGPSGIEKEVFSEFFIKQGLEDGDSILAVLGSKDAARFKQNLSGIGLDIKPYEEKNSIFVIDCIGPLI